MSYWVYLNDPETGKPVQVPVRVDGGVYRDGGSTAAELNVTYNYAQLFEMVWPSPLGEGSVLGAMLDGKRADATIRNLNESVEKLGTKRYKDYWAPTPGNAGYALSILAAWALEHPNAVWEVS